MEKAQKNRRLLNRPLLPLRDFWPKCPEVTQIGIGKYPPPHGFVLFRVCGGGIFILSFYLASYFWTNCPEVIKILYSQIFLINTIFRYTPVILQLSRVRFCLFSWILLSKMAVILHEKATVRFILLVFFCSHKIESSCDEEYQSKRRYNNHVRHRRIHHRACILRHTVVEQSSRQIDAIGHRHRMTYYLHHAR